MRAAPRALRALALCAAAALAGGCASGRDAVDPLEGYNRVMYGFNETFDAAVAKPVATAYKNALPEVARGWVRNFFSNIGDVFTGANNLLQGKPADALGDWLRVAFNTTFGLLGINDVAGEMGLEKHDEDFGQTLAVWGAPAGPYIVWPFLGPSTLRDSAGLAADLNVDPVTRHDPVAERNRAIALRFTGYRADLLEAGQILEDAALDKYIFQRDAWLQRRRSQVYDGSPPRESAPSSQAPAPTEAVSQDRSTDATDPALIRTSIAISPGEPAHEFSR